MDVTPLIAADRQIIQSYSPGGFKISGLAYQGAVTVLPGGTAPWRAKDLAALSADDFDAFDSKDVDVVLVGCGAKAARLPPAVVKTLKGRGIALEAMDTGAACRTYNVLVADGRRIAAALLPL